MELVLIHPYGLFTIWQLVINNRLIICYGQITCSILRAGQGNSQTVTLPISFSSVDSQHVLIGHYGGASAYHYFMPSSVTESTSSFQFIAWQTFPNSPSTSPNVTFVYYVIGY